MNKLINVENKELTMSSRDLLDMINKVRLEENETAVRVNQFHERVADELSDFNYKSFVVENLNNTKSTYFELTQDMCLLVAMRESKKVRRIVLKQLKDKFSQSFNVPQTFHEALLLASQQAKKIAEDAEKINGLGAELKQVKREKWQISSSREASVMAQVGHLKRKVKQLENEKDRFKDYMTVKAVEIITFEKFGWSKLKKASQELGLDMPKVPDPNFKEVIAYHAKAWLKAYSVDIYKLKRYEKEII